MFSLTALVLGDQSAIQREYMIRTHAAPVVNLCVTELVSIKQTREQERAVFSLFRVKQTTKNLKNTSITQTKLNLNQSHWPLTWVRHCCEQRVFSKTCVKIKISCWTPKDHEASRWRCLSEPCPWWTDSTTTHTARVWHNVEEIYLIHLIHLL